MSPMTASKRRTYGTGSIYQRKDGRWVAQIEAGWTETGRRRYTRRIAKTEAQAKVRLKELLRSSWDGQPGIDPRKTVKAWCETWLEVESHRVRPGSYRTLHQSVRKWIVPVLGRERLADLNASHMRKLERAIRDSGGSATVAHNVCSTMKSVLKAAVVDGYPIPQSILAAPVPRLPPNPRQAIPVQQAAQIINASFAKDSWVEPTDRREHLEWAAARPVDGTRWLAGLLLGMRQGEVLGLRWEDVDLDGGTLSIRWQLQWIAAGSPMPDDFEGEPLGDDYWFTVPKTSNGRRTLPLVQPMWQAMVDWRDRCPYSRFDLVWPNRRGGPQNKTNDRLAWRGVQRAAGVHKPSGEFWKVHEMRHGTASLLMAAKVPAPVVLAIVGHSTLTTTLGYSHATMADTRAALEGISEQLQIGR